jgi:hypothetical protein
MLLQRRLQAGLLCNRSIRFWQLTDSFPTFDHFVSRRPKNAQTIKGYHLRR